jgi:hypothetical protein
MTVSLKGYTPYSEKFEATGVVTEFRIYPTMHVDEGPYFTVVVFESVESLRVHLRKRDNVKGDRYEDTRAVFNDLHVVKFDKKKKAIRQPVFGAMLLAQDRLTHQTIAHECAHAMLGWIRNQELPLRKRQWLAEMLFNRLTPSEKSEPQEEACCHLISTAYVKILIGLKQRGFKVTLYARQRKATALSGAGETRTIGAERR